ncbi:UDP-N-acetylglucosamine 2-epimerase (non-hydrolyzing) [Gammaproteobacteria bacterium]|nr:UDP-N-acetylglucosamine 2-epimerase (non-hydrolyzing) [Gammaproteobacteria bacterium]|tara:strand:+ start:2581 stop:3726 length:1146 start_codon:yes stop_codon:yes gene_type:complete
MKKVMLVFGTRPEAIKMAPLSHAFKAEDGLETLVCVTAQHREMLDQVLSIFDLIPDIDLNLMIDNQDLFNLTASIITKMRDVLATHKPDIVLVHGDTTTTMATSIACFYAGISVGHVEAGLRTHNIKAPFPEEFNRRVASIVTKIHFAPTTLSRQNLINENIDVSKIFITGNTVIDSLHWVLNKIELNPSEISRLKKILDDVLPFNWLNTRYVLITGHRRENLGAGFIDICEAISILAKKHEDVHFIYPVHLNPKVQEPVNNILSTLKNVHLIPPLDYDPFVYLLKNSYLVLTDSGGIQEEAPSLGKPVLVMRDVTERPEALKAGTVKLVGANKSMIISSVNELLTDHNSYRIMSEAYNPYGDGKACIRIVKNIKDLLHVS